MKKLLSAFKTKKFIIPVAVSAAVLANLAVVVAVTKIKADAVIEDETEDLEINEG